jgi:hypothetical protein
MFTVIAQMLIDRGEEDRRFGPFVSRDEAERTVVALAHSRRCLGAKICDEKPVPKIHKQKE